MLGHFYLRKIWLERGMLVLRLVSTDQDWAELVQRLSVMSQEEREATAVIVRDQVQL